MRLLCLGGVVFLFVLVAPELSHGCVWVVFGLLCLGSVVIMSWSCLGYVVVVLHLCLD